MERHISIAKKTGRHILFMLYPDKIKKYNSALYLQMLLNLIHGRLVRREGLVYRDYCYNCFLYHCSIVIPMENGSAIASISIFTVIFAHLADSQTGIQQSPP
jgi:hypothetical protein